MMHTLLAYLKEKAEYLFFSYGKLFHFLNMFIYVHELNERYLIF